MQLDIDSMDYNKNITITIDFGHVTKREPIIDFIKIFADIKPTNMQTIFEMKNKDLQKYHAIIEQAVISFSKKKIKLNIKNNTSKRAPYIIGRAGIHTLEDEDWEIYKKESRGKVIGLSCVQSTVGVDVNSFFKEFDTHADFRKFILKTAKALLSANTIQRKKSREYFKNIHELNKDHANDFFMFSRNYIRLWNYDWKEEKQEHIISLLKSCQEEIDFFCHQEETIFKSCGIPIRFKIAFSSAFKNFDKGFLSKRTYYKTTIKKIDELYTEEMKRFIQTREKICDIFDGGDRIRFFRSGNFTPQQIIHELSYILNSFELPLFCYDFAERKGNISLKNFI